MLFQSNRIKIASFLIAMLLSLSVQADITLLSASLSAANQNGSDPSQVIDPLGVVASDATGSIQIHLDADNNTLDFKLDVQGIFREELRNFGPNGTPIHLHLAGGDNPGNFGPIAIDLSLNAADADFSDTAEGFQFERKGISILLEDQGNILIGMHPGNDQIVKALKSGKTFVLIHSIKDIFTNNTGPAPGFPFGEIRGNIKPVIKGWVGGGDSVVLHDAKDVPTAVAKLVASLEQQGFSIPLVINHSGAAASVGLELAPNQVIFARPPHYLEKWLLKKGNTMGIDLPLKFHVFEDHGVIKLSVNTLGYLVDRHDARIFDFVLRYTNNLIEQFGTSEQKGHGLMTVQSNQSVAETVVALQAAISSNPDARIPLVLDFSEHNNRYRRQHLSSVLVAFGNPNVGTPLIQADPRMGIDLPLKFLVWENRQGNVYITYNDPHFIARRIHLQGMDDLLDTISNALKTIAQAGAGL